MNRVRIQIEDFDVGKELNLLKSDALAIGAIVSFLGVVRNEEDIINYLELEHYAPMAEVLLNEIVQDAHRRWNLIGITLIHRIGRLAVGENIVLVAVSAKHRYEAFLAAEYIMNNVKDKVPIWKKEATKKGERWVEF